MYIVVIANSTNNVIKFSCLLSFACLPDMVKHFVPEELKTIHDLFHPNMIHTINTKLKPLIINSWYRPTTNMQKKHVQCRHLIPATVDRTSVSAWLYTHIWITCQ